MCGLHALVDGNNEIFTIAVEDEWELVPQTVSFMEAMNSGKRVSSKRGKYKYCAPEWILSEGSRLSLADINGEWFIDGFFAE
jgi:hypothetical protein